MEQLLFHVALAGPVLFITTALVFGALKPKYSPLHNTISESALGKYGFVQTTNFVVSGSLIVLLGVLLAGRHASIFGVIAIIAMGLVLLLSARYPTDPLTANGSTQTGQIHNGLFFLGMLAMLSAELALAIGRWGTAFGTFCAAIFGLSLVGLVNVMVLRRYQGLSQRVLVTALMTWVVVFGLR